MFPLSTLYFANHAVRVVVDPDGVPWFNASDVCAALELSNPRDALAKHVDSDDVAKRDAIDSLGRVQLASFINESGLYALTLGSKKDAAKRFKRWVTSEVLPELRRSGAYAVRGERLPVQPTYVLSDPVQAAVSLGKTLGDIPGVSSRTAMVAALQSLQDTTGFNTAAMRAVLLEEPAKATPPVPPVRSDGTHQESRSVRVPEPAAPARAYLLRDLANLGTDDLPVKAASPAPVVHSDGLRQESHPALVPEPAAPTHSSLLRDLVNLGTDALPPLGTLARLLLELERFQAQIALGRPTPAPYFTARTIAETLAASGGARLLAAMKSMGLSSAGQARNVRSLGQFLRRHSGQEAGGRVLLSMGLTHANDLRWSVHNTARRDTDAAQDPTAAQPASA